MFQYPTESELKNLTTLQRIMLLNKLEKEKKIDVEKIKELESIGNDLFKENSSIKKWCPFNNDIF